MKLLTIVVTYNGIRWIDKCIRSLVDSSVPTDVMVVDNESLDGTAAQIRRGYPQVEVVGTGMNLGFGRGNNIGMRRALDAGADCVFLLNQDARVEPQTIDNMIRVHSAHEEYGVLSPVHLNGTGDALDSRFADYMRPSRTPRFYSDLYCGTLGEVYDTPFVNAAAWLVTRRCIETVGGFDPLFTHYGEDEDYLNRVSFHGLKVGVVPSARIYHDRSEHRSEHYLSNSPRIHEYVRLKYPCGTFDLHVRRFFKRQMRILMRDLASGSATACIRDVQLIIGISRRMREVMAHRDLSRAKNHAFL